MKNEYNSIKKIGAFVIAGLEILGLTGCSELEEGKKIQQQSCAIEIAPYGNFRVVDLDGDGYADGFFKINAGNQQSYPEAVRNFNFVKPGLEKEYPEAKTMDVYMQEDARRILEGCKNFRRAIDLRLGQDNSDQRKRIGMIGLPYSSRGKK